MIVELIAATTILLMPVVIVRSLLFLRRSVQAERAQPVGDTPRMKELEMTVAALSAEVDRLQEAQRFMTKLLDDRASRREGARSS
jgi:hypothetical protein